MTAVALKRGQILGVFTEGGTILLFFVDEAVAHRVGAFLGGHIGIS
jgi:hypothetical protein